MHYYFASTYGSNAYNTSDYNGTTLSGSTGGSSAGGSTGSGGLLTDTGIALAVIVTLACLIALVAVAIRIWKRPARKLTAQTAHNPVNHVE